jgi:hypothetical protein
LRFFARRIFTFFKFAAKICQLIVTTTQPLGRSEVAGTRKMARTPETGSSAAAAARKTPVMNRGSWPAPPIKSRRPDENTDRIQSVLVDIRPAKSALSDCPSEQSKRDIDEFELKVQSRKNGTDGSSPKKTINLLKEMGPKKTKVVSVSDRGQPHLTDILKSIKKR